MLGKHIRLTFTILNSSFFFFLKLLIMQLSWCIKQSSSVLYIIHSLKNWTAKVWQNGWIHLNQGEKTNMSKSRWGVCGLRSSAVDILVSACPFGAAIMSAFTSALGKNVLFSSPLFMCEWAFQLMWARGDYSWCNMQVGWLVGWMVDCRQGLGRAERPLM